MSEVDTGVPPPKIPAVGNLAEWIMALSALATLALAFAANTNSSRISGIEEYLQSEIALRNRQVMQAEDRADSAARDRARATEDASFSQRQLVYNEFGSLVRRIGPAHANDWLIAAYANPPRALPEISINPGTELLNRVIDHYRDAENAHERALARGLRARCAEQTNTPLQFNAIPAALPMPSRSGASSPEGFSDYAAALSEWQRSTQAFSQATQARSRAASEAHNRAAQALMVCGLEILNGR